ncbi:MAG: peptidylprolyl isomerase [Oceanicaulis sp.]
MALRHALIFLAASFSLLAAPAAPAQQVEGIAAVVNDEPITTLDVRDRMRLIISSAGIQPDEETLGRIQEQAIRGLVEETLQLQQAREFDVDVTEAEVDESISDLAARNGATVEEITSDLAASGISIETLRRQMRAEIAWQILVSGRYRARIRISDTQIDTTLQREAAAASQEQFRLAEILVEIRPNEGGEEAAIQQVQSLYEMMGQGTPFPNLANQFSDAPSASGGGFLGWVPASALSEDVLDIVQQVPPGSITNPIRVPGGFQILAVVEKREGQAVEQLGLTQITIPSSRVTEQNRAAMGRAAGRVSGCDNAEAAFGDIEGAIVTPLGTLGANALVAGIRDALSPLEPGEATPVIDGQVGLQVFILCSRTIGGPGVPSVDEIEQQLIGQQLSLLARRWLRDLRREATIDIR